MNIKKVTVGALTAISFILNAPLQAEGNDKNNYQRGFIPVVLPYNMPETSWAIGFATLYYYNDSYSGTTQKPNEYSVYGTATLNKQYSIGSDINQYFRENRYKLASTLTYAHFPDKLWGIGPKTRARNVEDFTSNIMELKTAFLFKLFEGVYLGPSYELLLDDVVQTDSGGFLDTGTVSGSKGSTSSGLGFYFNLDSTDSSFYPHKGFYLEVINANNLFFFGSNRRYSELRLDFRYYLQLHEEHVLAFQSYSNLTFGDTPYQAMPKLGGDMIMRGYYDGRFRDKIFTAAQIEYRFPIYWIFGGAVFAAAGQVSPKITELSMDALKLAYGLGLRTTISKEEHINIRLDIGFDKNSNSNFYLIIKEAF